MPVDTYIMLLASYRFRDWPGNMRLTPANPCYEALDGLRESLVHTDRKMEANDMHNHTQLTALRVMTSV